MALRRLSRRAFKIKPIRILDLDYNFLTEIDDYESLIFTRKLKGCGDFTFVINNSLYYNLFELGHIVFIDENTAGFIEQIQTELSSDNNSIEKIKIYGKTLEHILYRRVTSNLPLQLSKTPESLIKELVSFNLGANAENERKIENFILTSSKERGQEVSWDVAVKNLGEEIEKICEASGFGISVTFNPINKKFYCDIIVGTDRTIHQNSLPPIILSTEYDNVLEQVFLKSRVDFKNSVLVESKENFGFKRKKWFGDSHSGVFRREIYVVDKSIEDDALVSDLASRTLLDTKEVLSLDGKLNQNANLAYGVDFFLGDFVTLKFKNTVMTKQVSEITQTFDDQGYKISVVFGKRSMDLVDKIKFMVKGR